MKLHQLFACAGALLLSGAAHAAILTGSTGSNPVENFSAPGSVAFNLGLQDLSHTTLSFELEAGDLAGPLSFDALVLNLAGVELNRFSFVLQGIRFGAAGTVTPSFGSLGTVKAGASTALIEFATPEFAEFQFGDVFGNGTGEIDWVLDTTGLQAGDRFTITATVPEPSTAALVLPMLCMAGLAAARRRRKD